MALITLYHSLGYFSRRQIGDIFTFFFPENMILHFVKIVSNEDSLHEMSNSAVVFFFFFF